MFTFNLYAVFHKTLIRMCVDDMLHVDIGKYFETICSLAQGFVMADRIHGGWV